MKLGVIGATLGHTASPAIHEKLFRLLGVAGKHEYGVLEMDRDHIPTELERLQREGYTGANVTIPYKLEVMPYLTDISREARIIGAVNTLHFTTDGIFGYNTDYGGFGRSLTHAFIDISKKDCYVLGTGGAARAITQYLADNGAATITAISRSPHEKATFEDFANRLGISIMGYDEFERLSSGDVLINCTPVGMFPHNDGCPLSEKRISTFPAVVDIIYNPKDTKLLQLAHQHGARTLNGMYMLVAQAIGSEEIWMGQPISSDILTTIAKEMEHYYEQ